MHRQSLGSPSTKQQQHLPLHSPSKLQQQQPYSSSSSSAASSSSLSGNESGEEVKDLKKLKLLKTKTKTAHENYIHFIPLLTLLCFLILYLSSHNPDQNDLNNFNLLHNPSEESVSELQRVVEIKSGDILAIRGLKNIVRRSGVKRRRLHRKIIADF